MGISDEDYASAIEHQRLHIKALSAEQAKAVMETITINTKDRYPANVSMTQSGSKVLNEQDLQHDAMKAPLSALLDMWTVRFSGEWVSEDSFQEDDFWRLALIRLVGANKLEKHHLANQYAAVYRIIE
jgi:hypothetical protein